MEEGVPPLPPASEPEPPPNSTIVPFNKATYVIQVPKEQIFRVPPPENAHFVEEYRNRMKNQKKTSPYLRTLARILAILLAAALLCLSSFLVFYLVAKPSAPHFTVGHISASSPLFSVTLTAQNPSATMDFHYTANGKVDLSHLGKQIAQGDPPAFDIGHKDTSEIKLSLRGSKAGLPKEINADSKGSKNAVPLSLSAKFPTKLGLGALQMRNKELIVNCDLRVSKWGKEMRIVSQNCNTKI